MHNRQTGVGGLLPDTGMRPHRNPRMSGEGTFLNYGRMPMNRRLAHAAIPVRLVDDGAHRFVSRARTPCRRTRATATASFPGRVTAPVGAASDGAARFHDSNPANHHRTLGDHHFLVHRRTLAGRRRTNTAMQDLGDYHTGENLARGSPLLIARGRRRSGARADPRYPSREQNGQRPEYVEWLSWLIFPYCFALDYPDSFGDNACLILSYEGVIGRSGGGDV